MNSVVYTRCMCKPTSVATIVTASMTARVTLANVVCRRASQQFMAFQVYEWMLLWLHGHDRHIDFVWP